MLHSDRKTQMDVRSKKKKWVDSWVLWHDADSWWMFHVSDDNIFVGRISASNWNEGNEIRYWTSIKCAKRIDFTSAFCMPKWFHNMLWIPTFPGCQIRSLLRPFDKLPGVQTWFARHFGRAQEGPTAIDLGVISSDDGKMGSLEKKSQSLAKMAKFSWKLWFFKGVKEEKCRKNIYSRAVAV